jgi:PTS system nitrogen regulatory IIA component
MEVTEFLTPDATYVEESCSGKLALLTELACRAAARLAIPADEIAAALIKREGLGTTGMGERIALPHARFQALKKAFGMLVKLNRPVDFDAIDRLPVDVIFVLLLPETLDSSPLGALAMVARRLRSPHVIARIRDAHNSRQLYDAVVQEAASR